MAATDLSATQDRLRRFRDDRGWLPFHTLKDLAASIAIEAAELQELMLWQRTEHEQALLAHRREDVEDELADVLIQCLNFAAVAEIDVLAAIDRKVDKNARKYPLEDSEPKQWR
jgi:NTP pyrophosphatase (non-canonical NTP hydrolase)